MTRWTLLRSSDRTVGASQALTTAAQFSAVERALNAASRLGCASHKQSCTAMRPRPRTGNSTGTNSPNSMASSPNNTARSPATPTALAAARHTLTGG